MNDSSEQLDKEERKFRFSIRSVMIWTAIVADGLTVLIANDTGRNFSRDKKDFINLFESEKHEYRLPCSLS